VSSITRVLPCSAGISHWACCPNQAEWKTVASVGGVKFREEAAGDENGAGTGIGTGRAMNVCFTGCQYVETDLFCRRVAVGGIETVSMSDGTKNST